MAIKLNNGIAVGISNKRSNGIETWQWPAAKNQWRSKGGAVRWRETRNGVTAARASMAQQR